MSEKTVKVRILKPVGTHKPGDDVDVTEEMAKQLCTPRKVSIGEGKFQHNILAMTHDDIDRLKAERIDSKGGEGLTQHELAEMGMKNVVETPLDPAFEAKLKSVPKGVTFTDASGPEQVEDGASFSETHENEETETKQKKGSRKAKQTA